MNYHFYLAKTIEHRLSWGIKLDDQDLPLTTVFSKPVNLRWFYSKSRKNKRLFRFIQQLLFYQQIHLTLAQSIHCLKSSSNKTLPQFILEDIETKLYQGLDFCEILASHRFFFDTLTISLISLGLKTGQLKTSLNAWLSYQTQIEHFYKSFRQQLFYPGLVFLSACGFLIFFVSGILPKYQALFTQLNQDFPIFILSYLDAFHGLMFVGMIAILSLFYKKIPGIKHLLETLHWYQWTELMGMTQASGLTLVDGMSLIQNHVAHELQSWHVFLLQEIRLGHRLIDAIKDDRQLPLILKDFMMLIPHQSDHTKLFLQAGFLLKKRLEDNILFMEKYLQPLLLIIMSLFCAGLFYILYLPLLELGKIL